MAKRKSATKRDKLKWKPAHHRVKAGLRLRVYDESTGRYRIKEFLAVEDLSFIAISTAQRRDDQERISLHATIEEAKAACERHLREKTGGKLVGMARRKRPKAPPLEC